jgi:hypothetical protein
VALKPPIVAALCLSFLGPLLAQQTAVTYLSREDAVPVFAALGEPLPSSAEWASWIAGRDRETRARIAEGDETTIVNWLLFGTSFTREPRVDAKSPDVSRAVSRRIDDLVRALDRNHEDTKTRNGEPALAERIEFARQVVGSGETARRRLVAALDRLSKEQEELAGRDREARQLGDSRLEFAERSRIYRDRGLATDTSLRSSFAIDEALRQLARDRGINAPIRRVAIVGPGIDFADKQAGYDAYPPQTIQPFAVQGSLLRLGLARPDALEVVALDLNDRVNAHISHAVSRSKAGQPYAIRLLLPESVAWTPEFAAYWQTFGEQIGQSKAASGTSAFKVRTIQVAPSLVRAVSASDVNVTAQRLELERAALFDLVIATNIFVYYDRLQQGLAAVSLSRMLRPDGFLLSNNAIVELPAIGLQSVGYSKTLNSDNPEDGDLVIWYRKIR